MIIMCPNCKGTGKIIDGCSIYEYEIECEMCDGCGEVDDGR